MERLLEIIDGVPVVSQETIDHIIDHASRVDKTTFKVMSLLLGACAVLASTARLLFRYRGEHKFYMDDWFVLFATVCLIAETGLLYSFVDMLYFIEAAMTEVTVIAHIARNPELTAELLNMGPSTLVAYVTLGWTSIFVIKLSFLALFHRLLRNVSRKLTAYFWCTVVATSLSGVVVIIESFIVCPQIGSNSAQCFIKNNYTFSISSGIVAQLLDIVTDLLIVSIPIILLRMSHLRLQHKLRIAVVVCLSSICIILSIVRLSAGLRRNVFGKVQFGVTWMSFMLHCEAAIAVMAGSVPALRAVYASRQDRQIRQNRQHRKSLTRLEEDSSTTKSLRSKASSLLIWSTKSKELLPLREPAKPKPSLSKWRQSIVTLIPKRVATIGSHSRRSPSDARDTSHDSGIFHPGVAYHAFRRQESMSQQGHSNPPNQTNPLSGLNQIRVTHETTVKTESNDKHWDLGEGMSQSRVIVTRPSSPAFDKVPYPEPTLNTAKGMDVFVDHQFGNIRAGLNI